MPSIIRNINNAQKTLCFDIDGTICVQTRGEYEKAKPFKEARAIVNRLYDEGYRIIFYSARYMGRYGQDVKKVYAQGYRMTLRQLKKWGFKFHKLYLGKPSHHILVDDKAVFYKHDWKKLYSAIKSRAKEDIY